MIEFTETLSTLTPTKEMIEDVRIECFNPLPTDYIKVLKENNGGIPVQKYGRAGERDFVIEAFLPLLNDEEGESDIRSYDLIQTYHDISDRLNDYCVPFAILFAGDIMCFSYENCDEPKIVLWNHELSKYELPHLTIVAENFRDFVSTLKSEV